MDLELLVRLQQMNIFVVDSLLIELLLNLAELRFRVADDSGVHIQVLQTRRDREYLEECGQETLRRHQLVAEHELVIFEDTRHLVVGRELWDYAQLFEGGLE